MMGDIHHYADVPETLHSIIEGYRDIKPTSDMTLEQAKSFVHELFKQNDMHYVPYPERMSHVPAQESKLGVWEGARGESKFIPNEETLAARNAREKLAEYGKDGIEYHDAEPDFSECSEATVQIDDMTEYRDDNFDQADEKCADLWNSEKKDGRTDWVADDVTTWRGEHHCSWHERCDTKTMDLVPQEIHGFFIHSGGVAECKARDSGTIGGDYDA